MPPEVDRPAPDATEWKRLSAWAVGTRVIKALPSLIPALIGLLFAARAAGPAVWGIAALLLTAAVGLVPWLTTRYRLTDTHFEVRSGLLRREARSARRERVRSVDVTANPVDRVLGLRTIAVGTGVGGEKAAMKLDPIRADEADYLARELLRRNGYRKVSAEAGEISDQSVTAEDEIARLRPSWIRYAPFSLTGFAATAAALGIGFRAVDDLHLTERGAEAAEGVAENLRELGPAVLIPGAVMLLVVVSATVSIAAYVLAFWGFRLTRRADGTLHTRRGLLSTVEATVERRRVRGTRVHEPVLMRVVHGAKVHALATGTQRSPLLLPPAPRADALRVADEALERTATVGAGLRSHGRKALRRRWTRGLIGAVGLVVIGAVGSAVQFVATDSALGWAPLVVGLALGVACIAPAPVRYRNLGHARRPGALVIGDCAVARTRVVLEDDGIIGWVTTESFFQRRSGVLTLHAATAVGARRYALTDLAPHEAAALAADVLPGTVHPLRLRSR
ncbi:PH domain-containing protein [Tsukamurella sp. 8F]|uniref:PH domain-containing protein n=1 Tax=unclassified Tsukamurella TaxID=2633480 RepID=UPI0023BA2CD2|nr:MULTISPECIES: PH domain-containing protein [unclassified Tsukamurella]MDF0529614.1 PH domain-containing protein [Tsukamurella sp. 8J]MDF0589275.1 PH domain-containing protein [Tsukamurella sp. 8F]